MKTPANCMVLFELMAKLMNLDFFFSQPVFEKLFDFREGEPRNLRFELLSFESHNLVMNGGSPILFLFCWPLVILFLIPLIPLSKYSPALAWMKSRLLKLFYIGFIIKVIQETSLEIYINSFLNLERPYNSPSGEVLSIVTTFILMALLLSSPIVIPWIYFRFSQRLTPNSIFASLYEDLYMHSSASYFY